MTVCLRWALAPAAVLAFGLTTWGTGPAIAAQPTIDLGTAAAFGVLAGSTVTNTGPSLISGDLGVSPGTAITGFPPGTVVNGTQHTADGVAAQAQSDLTTAYTTAAGQSPTANVTADLGGQTLVAGVYAGPTLGLTGTLTLDAANDPNAVFVFQASSTLITSSTSVVALTRGASPCNVFWQVGSSATLGTNSVFTGSLMALTSISAQTGATITGRLLAHNGATTLDSNTVTAPNCHATTPTASPAGGPTASPTSSATTSPAATPTSSPTGGPSATPTTGPSATDSASPTGTPTAGSTAAPSPSASRSVVHSDRVEIGTRSQPAPPTAVRRPVRPTLPHTGAPVASLAITGSVTIALGLLLLRLSVRRRRS